MGTKNKYKTVVPLGVSFWLILIGTSIQAQPDWAQNQQQIEPWAGNWLTWVIGSARDFRAPAPPAPAATQAELRALAELISHNDSQVREKIKYWDAGAPAYRWMDLLNSRILAGTATTPYPHRV